MDTQLAELREVTRASAEELSGVLRHFEAFLASSGRAPFEEGSTIDITHEALIREWVKLKGSKDVRGWAAKEAEAAKVYMRLAEAARRDAAPWRDPDLTEALALNKTFWNDAWAERYTHKEDRPEDTTRKGGTAQESAYRRAERFLEKSRRHRIFARVRTWGLVILLVLVGGGAYYIQVQQDRQAAELARRDAVIEKTRADAAQKAAEADRLAAEANQAGADRERLLAEAGRLRADAASLTASTRDYETLSQKREAELADLRTRSTEFEGKLQDAQERAAGLSKQLATADGEKETLLAANEDLAGRLSAAETARAQLETEIEEIKASGEQYPDQARDRIAEIEERARLEESARPEAEEQTKQRRDRKSVLAALNRYAATFEQKDWKSLMKYRPGLGPNERQELKVLFAMIRSLRLKCTGPPRIYKNENAAQVTCFQTTELMERGEAKIHTDEVVITLDRREDSWVIDSISPRAN